MTPSIEIHIKMGTKITHRGSGMTFLIVPRPANADDHTSVRAVWIQREGCAPEPRSDYIILAQYNWPGWDSGTLLKCPICDGDGLVANSRESWTACRTCTGTGRNYDGYRLRVVTPRSSGMSRGQRLRDRVI